jgi:uncharacterized protein (DUF305 family)
MIAAAMLLAAPGLAFAQTDPHHPTDSAPAQAQPQAQPQPQPQAQAQSMSPEMMPTMMQMMQNHMGMMHTMQGMQMMHMMQGMQMMHMMRGMQMQGGMGGDMPMMQSGMSDATAAYMAAMSKMNAPMMEGVQASNPDVAFVKAMIPHHQGAIDMARVELQYGNDETVKAWANQIIAAQEKEIAEMQEWLNEHGE